MAHKTLTNAEMRVIILAGGAIDYEGRLITRIEDLPSDEQITIDNPDWNYIDDNNAKAIVGYQLVGSPLDGQIIVYEAANRRFIFSNAAGGSGSGSVTNTGTLTSNRLIKGNGSTDITVSKVTITDPATTGTLVFGVDNSTITLQGTDTYIGRATTDTLTNKTLTSPTISGGTHSALTNLGIRSTGSGTFDLVLANTENLTAQRTLTFALGDASRTLTVGASASVSGMNTGDQTNISGNAATATTLQNARTINGTSFDGSGNVTVTAAAGTLTGSTLNSSVISSSLTSVGTIGSGAWNGTLIGSLYGGTGINTSASNGYPSILNGTWSVISPSTLINALLPTQTGNGGKFLSTDGSMITWATGGGGGGGTVLSVSVVTANGVSGSITNATTTPAITLSLGAISPTSVNGLTITNSTGTFTLANLKTGTISNTLTFSGVDGSTLNVGAGGTLGSAAYTASTAYTSSTLTNGSFLVGNGSNVATGVTPTGDVTFDNTGAFAVGSGKITNAMVNASAAIAYSKLNLTGTILNADLAGSIANAKLTNSTITIAGTSTSLGSTITQDTITGLSTTGIVKRTGANTLAIAVAGTDYLVGNQTIALSGDVTGSGSTAITTTLANIPSTTPMAGSILATNVAAPSTPAAGKTSLYIDSTSKNFAVKNDAGTVNHGIQTRTATGSNWIRSIADDGSTTISQPAFTDISGTSTAGQLPSTAVNSIVNDTNITGSISSQALTLGFTGTLAKARLLGTVVYTDQANTFGASIQTFQVGANYVLVDPADTTKKFVFDASNIATSTTRTINIPNANSTTVQPNNGSTNNFVTAISAQGVVSTAQPSFSNLSGTATSGQLPSTAVNSAINDTNVTGSVSAQALTLGWTGTLAAARLNANVVQAISNDTNVTGSISGQTLTLGFTGTLAKGRLLGTVVYTDQTNTFGAFVQTFQGGVNHLIVDPTDTTKKFQFDVSNIGTGTTKTVNIPNANSTTVQTNSGASNNFVTGISAQGVVSIAQPTFTNISGTATAAQLPATAVNSIVNDTNVTGVISAQALTLGWTGTLAKSRIISTAVFNDQANTFSTGAQDYGSATSLKIPTSAGASPTVSGQLAYDSTSNTFEYGENGTNRTVVNLDGTQTIANKTISGSSNTLSNIANAALTNSIVTIGSTAVSLGSTAATIAGLTLTTPTIASLVNANHNHTNAAGGGQLTDSALSAAVTVAKGGTGLTTTPTNGQIPIGNGSGYTLATLTGTANQITVTNTSGVVTLALAATVPSALPGQYALVFDSTQHHHVDHGKFWPQYPTTVSKIFYWEAWVKPDGNGGYAISEGYGSLHALLLGMQAIGGGNPTYSQVTGNVTTGTSTPISFGTDDGLVAGEWGHIAVSCDGTNLVAYLNGVPGGLVQYTYSTRSTDGNGGQGNLWVGGSGHSSYGGSIAMIRGFEGVSPIYNPNNGDGANNMLVAFRPETRFSAQSQKRGYALTTDRVFASFLADYTVPTTVVADYSPVGYNGGLHPGQLWATGTGGDSLLNQGFGYNPTQSNYPVPSYVVDTTAPTAARTTAPTVPTSATLTPPATPGSAKIFDSFSRANQTFAFDTITPTLGSTEAGSLGVKAWHHNVPQSTITVSATSGNYYITYLGQTSASIAFNASAATLKTALEGIGSIGAGNAQVTGGGPYSVTLDSTVGIPSSQTLYGNAAAAVTINATGGTFTVTYSSQTTSGIAFNASAATFKTAFEALSSVGSGRTSVTLNGSTYTIVFDVQLLTAPSTSNFSASGASLTGGAATATISASSLAGSSASASIAAASDGRGDNAVRWGILNGRACALGGGGSYQAAWVTNNSADMDIYVDRRQPTSLNDGRVGICYRVQDSRNFNYVIVSHNGTALDINWGDYTNASRTGNGGVANGVSVTGSWTTLRVQVSGTGSNNVTIYLDGSSIKTFTSSTFSTATGAGIAMADFGGGFSGTARFDNFTVK